MSIKGQLDTLSEAIEDIKTEIINKGQSVSSSDTVVSLASKIENISNIKTEGYSNDVLKDILEGTIKYLYDEELLYIRPYAFSGCDLLEKVYCTKLKKICPNAFNRCFNLQTIILPGEFVRLENINAFKFTLFDEGQGRIYVKNSLINTYKTASNWSYYSNYIYKFSDYS